MMKNETKICIYSAFLITLVVNSAKLLALKSGGIIAQYWTFDIREYSFQFLYNMLFCLLLFRLNLSVNRFFSIYRENRQWIPFYACNFLLINVALVLGTIIHSALFGAVHLPGTIVRGYFIRFLLSTVMVAVMIRLILLIREGKRKDLVNEQLRTAYVKAQLTLLQEQLNPHFFFNTLSSISAIIREDPERAQAYIMHLSKVFRYSLAHSGNDLVTLEKELQHLSSYTELIAMRLENAFMIQINIAPGLLQKHILHLSLQPLVENAVKHNTATASNPLIINLFNEGDLLVIQNNLQPAYVTESTGTGLANLDERFRLQASREIDIHRTEDHFIVKLPLL
ncbi:sensor histidine kinase [Chryseobacterium hagamense]|uniref:Signal transduction histidine kinase internal region domain-containing protein n=1 Tax=Chryseobacterium hagamense TaxID=395935 RepID=A0A511YPU9_9FLAO|nr:histidine kinase [Chryseobacterium hagamense]GEN77224.1 hypothetical protein CHA01nite_29640 [Chryseobacterium hagamense]